MGTYNYCTYLRSNNTTDLSCHPLIHIALKISGTYLMLNNSDYQLLASPTHYIPQSLQHKAANQMKPMTIHIFWTYASLRGKFNHHAN